MLCSPIACPLPPLDTVYILKSGIFSWWTIWTTPLKANLWEKHPDEQAYLLSLNLHFYCTVHAKQTQSTFSVIWSKRCHFFLVVDPFMLYLFVYLPMSVNCIVSFWGKELDLFYHATHSTKHMCLIMFDELWVNGWMNKFNKLVIKDSWLIVLQILLKDCSIFFLSSGLVFPQEPLIFKSSLIKEIQIYYPLCSQHCVRC